MVAKVIGYDELKYKRLTCGNCCAIIQYANIDKVYEQDDYLGGGGYKVYCPACNYPNSVS